MRANQSGKDFERPEREREREISLCIIWSSPTRDLASLTLLSPTASFPVQWCFCTFRRAGRLHLQSSWRRGAYLVCDASICSHSSSGTLRFSSICCLAWECGEDWREWLCSTLHFTPCFYLFYLLMLSRCVLALCWFPLKSQLCFSAYYSLMREELRI